MDALRRRSGPLTRLDRQNDSRAAGGPTVPTCHRTWRASHGVGVNRDRGAHLATLAMTLMASPPVCDERAGTEAIDCPCSKTPRGQSGCCRSGRQGLPLFSTVIAPATRARDSDGLITSSQTTRRAMYGSRIDLVLRDEQARSRRRHRPRPMRGGAEDDVPRPRRPSRAISAVCHQSSCRLSHLLLMTLRAP